MERPKSSYTEDDYNKHTKHLEKYPNSPTWTTLDGHVIPVVMLKDDHLKNVIRHQEERLKALSGRLDSYFYTDFLRIHNICLKEMKKRLIKKSVAGRLLFGD
jgi:hypothetical protein